jgi:hypothetical protein
VSKDFDQTQTTPRKFKLGPLGSLNQVTKGLAKTIRAMADGTLDSQVGARICNGLGIMRACLETQKLEQLEARMDEIADRIAPGRAHAAATIDLLPTQIAQLGRLTAGGERNLIVLNAGDVLELEVAAGRSCGGCATYCGARPRS